MQLAWLDLRTRDTNVSIRLVTRENIVKKVRATVLLAAIIAKVPNISQFIRSSCFTGKYSKSINGLELCLTKARINIHQHGIIFTYPLVSLKSATSSIGFNDLIN